MALRVIGADCYLFAINAAARAAGSSRVVRPRRSRSLTDGRCELAGVATLAGGNAWVVVVVVAVLVEVVLVESLLSLSFEEEEEQEEEVLAAAPASKALYGVFDAINSGP
jgi:hypothetical protein